MPHICADVDLLTHSKIVTLASEFLSQNYMFHNDSSTTCLSGKPQGLLAASLGEVQTVRDMPKHTPGPCPRGHVNQQLRELRGCRRPTPPQPPAVKVMVDNSCKRVMREDMSGCSDMARWRAGVHLVHRGKLEGTLLFISASPSPAVPHGYSPCGGSNVAPHAFRQMSLDTMPAC